MQDRRHIGKIVEILKRETFPTSVAEAVSLVTKGADGAGVRPMQVPEELEALIDLVKEKQPRTLVEIGTARGGTLLLLCRFAAPDSTIISIDLPYGRNGGGYPRWKEPIYRSFARPGQSLHLLRADSHDPKTFRSVEAILSGRGLDFMLIDADHSYEGVKTDFELYRPLVKRSGALIALHDILDNEDDPSIDVNRFWLELETQKVSTKTIVHHPEQGHSGIGLVLL